MVSFSSGKEKAHDPDLCACGCRTPVAYSGLEPRFASGACRRRWVTQWAIRPCEPEPAVLDDSPQAPPPPADPVPAEEVAQVQAEFAQRVVVAPQVEAMLSPSGMWVALGPRSVWKTLRGLARKVW